MAYMTWKDILVDVGLDYERPRHRSRWIRDAAALARHDGKSVPEHLAETVQRAASRMVNGKEAITPLVTGLRQSAKGAQTPKPQRLKDGAKSR